MIANGAGRPRSWPSSPTSSDAGRSAASRWTSTCLRRRKPPGRPSGVPDRDARLRRPAAARLVHPPGGGRVHRPPLAPALGARSVTGRAAGHRRGAAPGRGRAGPENPIGIGWAGPTLVLAGTEEQQQRLLPGLLDGSEVWCQLFSEPGGGQRPGVAVDPAVRDGDEWVVNGQKIWTSLARQARYGILLARTDPDAPRHRGISYFVVDMRSPGIEIRPIRQMNGGADFNEVFLDAVRVPAGNLVGTEGDGWRLARVTLGNERVALSEEGALWGRGPTVADLVDAVRAARPDAARPLARQRLAALYVEAEMLRILRLRHAWPHRSGARRRAEPGPEASVRKALADRHGQKLFELAVDLCGADGMLDPAQPAAPARACFRGRSASCSPRPSPSAGARPRCSATSSPSGCSGCPGTRPEFRLPSRRGERGPDPDGVVLWTRVSGAAASTVPVHWPVATDADAGRAGGRGLGARPARTATTPSTWWCRACGRPRPTGTASPSAASGPRSGGPGRCRRPTARWIGCGSGWCAAPTTRPATSTPTPAWPSGTSTSSSTSATTSTRPRPARSSGRAHPPPPGRCLTLPDYRGRYAQYRTDPDLQALHARHPMVAVWDDHELAGNAWWDGAAGHDARDRRRLAPPAGGRRAGLPGMGAVRPARPGRSVAGLAAGAAGPLSDLVMLDTRLAGRERPAAGRRPVSGSGAGTGSCWARRSGAGWRPWSSAGRGDRRWRCWPARSWWRRSTAGRRRRRRQAARAVGGGLIVNPGSGTAIRRSGTGCWSSSPTAAGEAVVLSGDLHSSWVSQLAAEDGRGAPVVPEFTVPAVSAPTFARALAPKVPGRPLCWSGRSAAPTPTSAGSTPPPTATSCST